MRPTRLSLFQNTKISRSRSRCPTGRGFPCSRLTNITNKKQPADLFTLSNSGLLRSTTVNYGLHRTRLANRNPPGPVNPRPKPASISTASLPPASADSNSPTRTKMESWQLLTAPGLSKLSYSGESPLLRDPLVWCLHSGALQLGFCGFRLCNLHHPVGKGSN